MVVINNEVGACGLNNVNKPETEVVFLFGAGASVDAGIPDTYSFVIDFEDHIKQHNPELTEQLSSILSIIEKFNEKTAKESKKVDVEQLLYTLRRLIERDSDALLAFYEEKKCDIEIDGKSLGLLKTLLEDYIRERVIIEDETKLDYLKELLVFDKPLEIFSTNYDTCIEQLSHSNHMRYTDGFDIYWNPKNFSEEFDVKHYKMHGSVIWYEDMKTKECVKIPVHAFVEGKPVALRLIYGEDVKPLLIYPAQKAEYVEPLTDLQLRFKERLFNKRTRFVVVVGYSFRDDYIIHMLWDAARVNENLHVVLISPNAQQIFENKLKFINREKNDLSRIYDRVICLPYPFSTIIYELKNHYLNILNQILRSFKDMLEGERSGGKQNWDFLVRWCINAEFLTKAETALQKAKKNWQDLDLGASYGHLLFGFKALLHSVICKDGFEDNWLKRINYSLKNFSVEKLKFMGEKGELVVFGFDVDGATLSLADFLKKWVSPLLDERKRVVKMLTSKYESKLERIENDLNKLKEFYEHLSKLSEGVNWRSYEKSENDSDETKAIIDQFKEFIRTRQIYTAKINSGSVKIEQNRLRRLFGKESLEFELQ